MNAIQPSKTTYTHVMYISVALILITALSYILMRFRLPGSNKPLADKKSACSSCCGTVGGCSK